MYFSLCFLQSTKTLGLIHNSISNLWKHGEEKADWLGTLRSGERHNSDLSGFVFCFTYPVLGAGEVSSPVVPMDRQKEKKKKPSRNTGCIQLKDKEIASNKHRGSSQTPRKTPLMHSTPIHKGQVGSPELHLHLAVRRWPPTPPSGWWQRAPREKPGLSLTFSGNEHSAPPPGFQWGTQGSSQEAPSLPFTYSGIRGGPAGRQNPHSPSRKEASLSTPHSRALIRVM